MLPSIAQRGCSARVEMQLLVNGTTLAIGQMGPDFLLLDKPIDHPPTHATITLRVDTSERRWVVYLPDGMAKDRERVAIREP